MISSGKVLLSFICTRFIGNTRFCGRSSAVMYGTSIPKCTSPSKVPLNEYPKKKQRRKNLKIRTWNVQWGVVNQVRKMLINKNSKHTFFFWDVGSNLISKSSLQHLDLLRGQGNINAAIKYSELNYCDMTEEEFKRIFRNIVQCNDSLLFEKVQKELIRRLPEMDLPSMMYFADGLYQRAYNISKDEGRLEKVCSKYFLSMFHCLSLKWEGLAVEVSLVVQLMFYASLYRVCRPELLHRIEEFLENNIEAATLKEITVLCHSFFAINHSIKLQSILQGIADKVLQNYEDLDIISLSNIMKALRHAGYSNKDFYENLGDRICKSGLIKNLTFVETPTWITHVSHVLVTYSSIRHIHDNLMHQTISKIEKELPDILDEKIRQKDLIRCLYALQNSGCPIPNGIAEKLKQKLIKLVNEKDEYTYIMYAESFTEGVLVLACCGIVEKKLLHRIFDARSMLLKERGKKHNY